MSNHLLCNDIDQIKKSFSSSAVITKINYPRVYRFVSDNSHYIQRLLNQGIQALLDEGCDVLINVLSELAKMCTEFLNR